MEIIIALIALIIIFSIAFLIGAKQGASRTINKIKKDGGYYDLEYTSSAYPYVTSSANDVPNELILGSEVDTFQKLAGIKPTNPNDELRQILVNNNLNSKERIISELVNAAKNSDYPAPDIKANAMVMGKILDKWTTPTDESNDDPLAHIPMSRVSFETKAQIAELARQDISKQLEEAAKLMPIPEFTKPELSTDIIKPKRKYKKRNRDK